MQAARRTAYAGILGGPGRPSHVLTTSQLTFKVRDCVWVNVSPTVLVYLALTVSEYEPAGVPVGGGGLPPPPQAV